MALACSVGKAYRTLRVVLGAAVLRPGICTQGRQPQPRKSMLPFAEVSFLSGAVGIFPLAIVAILMYLLVAPLEKRELLKSTGGWTVN